jgi:hypothetical protein
MDVGLVGLVGNLGWKVDAGVEGLVEVAGSWLLKRLRERLMLS